MDPTDIRRIVLATCRSVGADPDVVMGRDRRMHAITARRACMVAAYLGGASVRDIARIFGRGKSTVGSIVKIWRGDEVATRTPRGQCCAHATGCD